MPLLLCMSIHPQGHCAECLAAAEGMLHTSKLRGFTFATVHATDVKQLS